MKKNHSIVLALLAVLIGINAGGCSLRVLQKKSGDRDGHKLPPEYSRPVRALLTLTNSAIIEDSLLAAYAVLEDQWGQKEAEEIVDIDPVFNNEFALFVTRKGDFSQAEHYLEKAWEGLQEHPYLVTKDPFRAAAFNLEDRLYDDAAMNLRRDQALLSTFRDFYFHQQRSEREFVNRVMQRTHRFPPQPSLFPGSLATIPIEIVNDWNYQERQVDLLTWQRFTHLPSYFSPRQVRQMQQSLAVNLFLVGILQGNKQTVSRALDRLEANAASSGRFIDRQAQGVLMLGYYMLADEGGVQRHADPVLKPLLMP